MLVGIVGCWSSKPSSSMQSSVTDESIILRCRIDKVSIEKIDRELGDEIHWKQLKSKMKPNDELWSFCTPGSTWENMMGWEGYALFRKDKLVGSVTTKEN
jgi:hypothetical protein